MGGVTERSAGSVLGGRYRLESPLRLVELGEVWRAYDTVLDRAVAITILRADLAEDGQFRAAWRSELRTQSSMPSTGVVDYVESVPGSDGIPGPGHNGDPVVACCVQLLSADERDLGDPGGVPAPVRPHQPPSLAVARE